MRPLLEHAALIKCARAAAEWLFGSVDAVGLSTALPQWQGLRVSEGEIQC